MLLALIQQTRETETTTDDTNDVCAFILFNKIFMFHKFQHSKRKSLSFQWLWCSLNNNVWGTDEYKPSTTLFHRKNLVVLLNNFPSLICPWWYTIAAIQTKRATSNNAQYNFPLIFSILKLQTVLNHSKYGHYFPHLLFSVLFFSVLNFTYPPKHKCYSR